MDPTSPPDNTWLAGAGAVVTGIVGAAIRIVSGNVTKANRGVDEIKRDYVRRDDIGIHLAPIHATLSAIASDVSSLRERTHDIANAVAKLEGRQERREALERPR